MFSDKVTAYKCRLCDCQFNDLNAKEMHLKGRRHRAQYKKKVDHTIELAPKPPSAQRRDMGPVPAWAAREFGFVLILSISTDSFSLRAFENPRTRMIE